MDCIISSVLSLPLVLVLVLVSCKLLLSKKLEQYIDILVCRELEQYSDIRVCRKLKQYSDIRVCRKLKQYSDIRVCRKLKQYSDIRVCRELEHYTDIWVCRKLEQYIDIHLVNISQNMLQTLQNHQGEVLLSRYCLDWSIIRGISESLNTKLGLPAAGVLEVCRRRWRQYIWAPLEDQLVEAVLGLKPRMLNGETVNIQLLKTLSDISCEMSPIIATIVPIMMHLVESGCVRWSAAQPPPMTSPGHALKLQSARTKSLSTVLRLDEPGLNLSRFKSDFEVLELLGKGGFGKVFKTKNKMDHNLYAVKKIPSLQCDSARELVLSDLNHPGVVRYYSAWVETNDGYPPSSDCSRLIHFDSSSLPVERANCASVEFDMDWIGTARFGPQRYKRLQTSAEEVLGRYIKDESVDSIYNFNEHLVSKPPTSALEGLTETDVTELTGGSSDSQLDERISTDRESGDSSSGDSNSDSKPKDVLFIQMELCRKMTLNDWLGLTVNRETRNRNQILDMFYQIVSVVEYIHSHGLMHRDLKPSNILFSLDGKSVKVGDFGLAKAQNSQGSIVPEVHTVGVGTPLYKSPELKAGGSYDEKTDVYSLGMIFLEFLSPFGTDMERIKCLEEARKLKFSTLSRMAPGRNWIRKGDETLLGRLLVHNPGKRPSAAELLREPLFNDLFIFN